MKKDGGKLVKKTHDKFNDRDKVMILKNARKYCLLCGLDRSIYKSIE